MNNDMRPRAYAGKSTKSKMRLFKASFLQCSGPVRRRIEEELPYGITVRRLFHWKKYRPLLEKYSLFWGESHVWNGPLCFKLRIAK